MIPNKIVDALLAQNGEVQRLPGEKSLVSSNIKSLGLAGHEEIEEFFSSYDLAGVSGGREVELLDLCSPSNEILETTEWAKDIYQIGENFVCLTSGEGEGFILYSKTDRKVYDVSVSEIPALKDGQVCPNWNSFFELIEWYLS
jgi:hypothetical protein